MIRISTRQSPLALWQAHFVGALLEQYLQQPYQLIAKQTAGDIKLSASLAWQGGKGLFLKELQQDLLNNHADIAVHSMKDVPVEPTQGLAIVCILTRHSVADALICNHYNSLAELPRGAVVGTSSLRRQAQLLHSRADLTIKLLRGNIHTRLSKLDAAEYDAIILAKAGLERMQLQQRIQQTLAIDTMLPAVSQGAIGIECRQQDSRLIRQLQVLNDPETQLCINTERLVSEHLGGNCHAPIGALAKVSGQRLHLRAMVADAQGQQKITFTDSLAVSQWQQLAERAAQRLIEQGALAMIANAVAASTTASSN